MSTILRFLSNEDFQRFTAQLFSAEFPNFQAIEGAGGDGGLDGIDGDTGFQMYFPEEHNRTKAKFIAKIDSDISKMVSTADKLGLQLTRWVLVVPVDLRTDVVAHLMTKSRATGVTCLYWGATKLGELAAKHPHVQESFPGIFLPAMKQDIGQVKDGVDALTRRHDSAGVEIIGDDEYDRLIEEYSETFRQSSQGAMERMSHTSAGEQAVRALHAELNAKRSDLMRKKGISDRAFILELEDLNAAHVLRYNRKQSELNERGMLYSGAAEDLTRINEQHERDLERLKLRYGKR
ncbi:hypothetical protein HJC99_01855 [Candidatus Saccharibacteria bacterium]|nr:hypothetical protein [Candidatus Saccharibacteria bacterium]